VRTPGRKRMTLDTCGMTQPGDIVPRLGHAWLKFTSSVEHRPNPPHAPRQVDVERRTIGARCHLVGYVGWMF
jgi:hypothetical protein